MTEKHDRISEVEPHDASEHTEASAPATHVHGSHHQHAGMQSSDSDGHHTQTDVPSPAAPGASSSGLTPTHHADATHGHATHGDARPGGFDEHANHDKHAGHSVEMFRRKFWGTFALTIPTLVWTPMLQSWLHYSAPVFSGSQYIPALFGTLVFAYGGLVFLQGARHELATRRPGMMTLISLAITVAFLFSVAVTFGFPGMDLWWELATLVTIMVLGHWVEMASVAQAQGALKELAKLLPTIAVRVVGDKTEDVPLDQLRTGDIVLIRPGAQVPADGLIRDGASAVNESMITGESRPVEKVVNAKVIAGTINGAGSLRVEVTGTGDTTALAGIMRLVEEAQNSRSRAQVLADRAAFLLTIIALVSGAATVLTWLLVGAQPAYAIERLVTVLVIACPHALGLAVPLVTAISTTMAAHNGLLVRNRRGLEEARNVNMVFFDKTGTLTRGEFRVVEIATVAGVSEEDALRLGAAVERDSEHPIAQGIVKTAEERQLTLPPMTAFAAIPGHGVEAVVDAHRIALGGPALLRRANVALPPVLQTLIDSAAARGQAAISILRDDQPVAVLAIADAIREESREAIRMLHELHVEVVMMTGDATAVANAVARELGIDTVFAEVLPEQKSTKIDAAKKQGKTVAMVGDGVNDAPALLTAHVGIAIGAGTDVAVEAGDIVLVRNDPRDIPRIIALSKATYRKMLQNLWWAAGYNIVAIPLAAGVLAPWGIVLHPAVGAVLMSLSTVIVALNAQLLRRARI